MKKLIIAAVLFLGSFSSQADDHAVWGVAWNNYTGEILTAAVYDEYPEKIGNLAVCQDDILAIAKSLSAQGVPSNYVGLECVDYNPLEK